VWDHLVAEPLSTAVVGELVSACEGALPDTENFSSVFTSAAGDAGAALIYTLECCLDGDTKRAAVVGRLSMHSIYMYLHIVNDPETGTHTADAAFDEWLENAPLISAEIRKQRMDIQALKSHPGLDHHLLDELRRSSGHFGIQPFARGLVRRVDGKAHESTSPR
jgi:uncharacterized protein YjaG (DUF416 family)